MPVTRIGLAVAVLFWVTSQGTAAGDKVATTIAEAAERGPVSATSAAFAPPVRKLEVVGPVTGAEPDPESFDRAGLEIWWRHYTATPAMRAENMRR